jgi:integrase
MSATYSSASRDTHEVLADQRAKTRLEPLGGDDVDAAPEDLVEYRGRPVKTIRGGLRSAVERAGLPFGRAVDGATFHTLRHTAASLLADLREPEAIRKEVMGHRNIATTQRYTHLRPIHEIPAHERLADAVPIADLVTATRKRASGKPAQFR